jgi:molybdopterin synthase catalytic subunit
VNVRPVKPEDRDEWLRMRAALWTDSTAEELAAETAHYHTGGRMETLPAQVLVLDRGNGKLGGFAEMSLRPGALGCVTSPVGYLEGWYVDQDLRRRGLGAALVRAGEAWAASRGCGEIASDCMPLNHASRLAHLSLGFQPAQRHVLFRKTIGNAPAPARDHVGLVAYPLSVETAVDFVTDPSAGGIDVFLGTTRGETNADGRELVALDYEAYAEMASAQLRELATRVRERWPVLKLALLHRVGRVNVGEPSVLIAVSTPHRGEAFEACRWLIDTLKADVAVWKKEVWSDGSGTWVQGSVRAVRD